MNRNPKKYSIWIEGHLQERWKAWFTGMTAINQDNGEVLLEGILADQSALVGIINQIHNLNLILIRVESHDLGDTPER